MSFIEEVPSAEELAEDYKSSLEDLSVNSRWEITNLTVIAKENIHAAQAISKVIEEHIQKTPPARKLPALYLLDSIAKNVGTPYTLFFGRNLYRTFMDSYTLVESPVRRKLEEMLQTWKQPVPGSTSSQPLFPADTTRKIDNALIKARTAAVQQQQKQMKQDSARLGLGQSPLPSSNTGIYRSTPTPPMANGQAAGHPYGPPPPQNQETRNDSLGNRGTPQPSIQEPGALGLSHSNYQQLAAQLGLSHPALLANAPTTDALLNDIRPLIATTQTRFAEIPWDTEVQKRLKALLDLQTILSTQQLPTDQLSQIRDQLSRIAISVHVSAPSTNLLPPPPPPQSNALTLPLNQTTNLATLLQNFSKAPQLQSSNTTPLNLQGLGYPVVPQKSNVALPAGNDLFTSLLSAGLLKSSSSTPQPSSVAKPSTPLNTSLLLSGLVGNHVAAIATSNITGPNVNWETLDINLSTSSLKAIRPHFVSILNESLPNKCGSCARRFLGSEQGRKDKAAHLDWHFRVQQRIADSNKHAQFRSWYVGEEEWIKFREDEDDLNTIIATQNPAILENSIAITEGAAKKDSYVHVPNDPALQKITCPVCKEKFEPVLHPELEEWVWMDAVKEGGRVYHASCYAEVSKDGPIISAPISRGSTPDNTSGKGKRKAEQDLASVINKLKREK